MLNAVYGSIGLIFKRPHALIPLFIAALINAFFSIVFSLTAIDLAIKIVSQGMVTNTGVVSAVLFFLRVHAESLATLLGIAVAATWVTIVFGIYYCRYVKTYKKGSIGRALGFAFKSIPNSIALLIAVLVVSFIIVLGGFTLALAPMPGWLYAILLGIYTLVAFLIVLRLFLFVMPALAHRKSNAKRALQASWSFTEKHFWEALLLTAIFIIFVFSAEILRKIALAGIEDTIATALVLSVFNAVMLAFCLGTLTLYYEKHIN